MLGFVLRSRSFVFSTLGVSPRVVVATWQELHARNHRPLGNWELTRDQSRCRLARAIRVSSLQATVTEAEELLSAPGSLVHTPSYLSVLLRTMVKGNCVFSSSSHHCLVQLDLLLSRLCQLHRTATFSELVLDPERIPDALLFLLPR